MKVIGAGFGRTGTLSLKTALEELGMVKCYHMFEVFRRPGDSRVWNQALDGKSVDWPNFFQGYQAIVDWPGCTFYQELMAVYPDAKVVLSVRDPEKWYESVLNTILSPHPHLGVCGHLVLSTPHTTYLYHEPERHLAAHPTRPILYLGMLLHPTSYLFFTKYGGDIWPNYKRTMPPEISTLLADLSTTFGLTATQPENPFAVYVGVSTQETEEEGLYWRTCDKPYARFFVQSNPHYSAGYGLLTLMPFSTGAFLRSLARFVRDRAQRNLEPLFTTAQQWPLTKQLFGVQKIQHMLRQTPLCADLPDAEMRLLTQTAELIALPAGRYLFRAGDRSDEMYVVAAGAVYVVVERNGEERIVDQLATGAMFGEIALLSGEVRTAAIRTAIKCTLIRLKRKQLLALMETHPTLRDAIWQAYSRRRFADLTASPSFQFAHLSRQQRMAWLAQGQVQTLTVAEKSTVQTPWFFVLTGTVELQQQQQWSTLRAPALIQITDVLQISAQSTTHYVCLPNPMDY